MPPLGLLGGARALPRGLPAWGRVPGSSWGSRASSLVASGQRIATRGLGWQRGGSGGGQGALEPTHTTAGRVLSAGLTEENTEAQGAKAKGGTARPCGRDSLCPWAL